MLKASVDDARISDEDLGTTGLEEKLIARGLCAKAAYKLANMVNEQPRGITSQEHIVNACPWYVSMTIYTQEIYAQKVSQPVLAQEVSPLEIEADGGDRLSAEVAEYMDGLSVPPGCSTMGDFCARPKRGRTVPLSSLNPEEKQLLGLADKKSSPYNSHHAEHQASTLNREKD